MFVFLILEARKEEACKSLGNFQFFFNMLFIIISLDFLFHLMFGKLLDLRASIFGNFETLGLFWVIGQ
jgi:hypothetical protein